MFAASARPTRGGKAGLSSYEIRGDRQGILGSFFRLVHSSLEICREDLARRALQPAREGETESPFGAVWLRLLNEASDILNSLSVAPSGRTLSVIATAEGYTPASGEDITPLQGDGGTPLNLEPLLQVVADQEFETDQTIEDTVIRLVDSLPLNLRRTLFYSQFECRRCGRSFETFAPLKLSSPPNASTVCARPVRCECGGSARFVRGPVISLPMLQRRDGQPIGPVITKMGYPAPRDCTQVPPPVEHFLTSVITSKPGSGGSRKRESYCVFVNTASRSDTKVFALYSFANSSLRTKSGGKAAELTFLLREKFLKFLTDDTQGGVHSAIGSLAILCYMDSDKMRPEAKSRIADQYPTVRTEPPPPVSPEPRVEAPLPKEDTVGESSDSDSYDSYDEPTEEENEELPKGPTLEPFRTVERKPSPEPAPRDCCAGSCAGHVLLWTAIIILFILIIILAVLVGILFSKLSGTFETDDLLVRHRAVIGYQTFDGWLSDYYKAEQATRSSMSSMSSPDLPALGVGGGVSPHMDTQDRQGQQDSQKGASAWSRTRLRANVELDPAAEPGTEATAMAGDDSSPQASSPQPPSPLDVIPLGSSLRPDSNYSLFVRSGFFDHLYAYDPVLHGPALELDSLTVGFLNATTADIGKLDADDIDAKKITFTEKLTQDETRPAEVENWTVNNRLRAGKQSGTTYSLLADPGNVQVAGTGTGRGLEVRGTITAENGEFETASVTNNLDMRQGTATFKDATIQGTLTMDGQSKQLFRGSSYMTGGESGPVKVEGDGIRVMSGKYIGSTVEVANVIATESLKAEKTATLENADVGNLKTTKFSATEITVTTSGGSPTITLSGTDGTASFTKVEAGTATITTKLDSQGTSDLNALKVNGNMNVDGIMSATNCRCGSST